MSQSHPCKERGCNKSVSYTQKKMPAVGCKTRRSTSKIKSRKRSQIKRTFTAYLTCSTGHCHPYTVSD